MPPSPDQILTVEQMRAAEQALIDAGTSVDQLMQIAGRGAAEWVWRLAAHRPVTVLCGPGNNGGDGYVIAESLREKGGRVQVIAAVEPKTDAARNARSLYRGEVLGPDADVQGEVLVDCLFGSGLTRGLSGEHLGLLQRLACSHRQRIAVDLPSGVESDSGAALNQGLPQYDLVIALGAWKFAHFLAPAASMARERVLVPIGCAAVIGAARGLGPLQLDSPPFDAHKYTRGLVVIVAGEMHGAAALAGQAALHGGAGNVRIVSEKAAPGLFPPEIVHRIAGTAETLGEVVSDRRNGCVLVGPGLGRDSLAQARLKAVQDLPMRRVVIDADALHMLRPGEVSTGCEAVICTPHDGEMAALEKIWGLSDEGTKTSRALALAKASGMIVVFKGSDTVIAAPDGEIACAPRSTPWLSTAGSGDVLAGCIAARLSGNREPFRAVCEGVLLHAEAGRLAAPSFSAADLAGTVREAYAANL